MIRLRLNAYTMERCRCGEHPRIMAVASLLAAFRARRV